MECVHRLTCRFPIHFPSPPTPTRRRSRKRGSFLEWGYGRGAVCGSGNRGGGRRPSLSFSGGLTFSRSLGRVRGASLDGSEGAEKVPAPIADLASAKVLVEASMLAAVSGVTQLLLGVLRLDAYMYYFLPFPLVLAALRSGPDASRKTLVATFFLNTVLLGPPRAVTYVLLYGMVGGTLGVMWHWRCPWWMTWPTCTVSYVVGMFSYIHVASFLLKENLFKLVTYNVYNTVVSICALCGMPSMESCILERSLGLVYTSVLLYCYTILLNSMGYPSGPMPQFIERLVQRRNEGNNSR